MDKKISIKKDHVQVKVDSRVYSKETIFAAGYIFLDKAYVLVDQENKNYIVCLYPKKRADMKKIGYEFYNELLNYAHYFSRVKANASAVKTLLQRALFSAAPELVEDAQDEEIQKLIKKLEKEESEENEKASRK